MRERRRGALGRATDIAGDVAAAVRRAQRGREPRVLLYDAAGYARRLAPDSEAHDEVLAAAERLVELVELGERETRRNDGDEPGGGGEPGDGP